MDKLLLIVDDNESVRILLESTLKKWAENNNVNIIASENADQALVILDKNSSSINVLLTDHNMPFKSGLELIKIVSEKYPDAVSILMTGYSDFADLEEIIDAGLFAFIKKPWKAEEMTNTVDRALKYAELKYSSREQEKLISEDLCIASEFQKVFLKFPMPESSHFNVEITHKFAHNLYFGGDYYDIFNLGGEEYLFMLGDVAGHGLKASFFTAILKAIIFPEYIKDNSSISPALFLEWLNNRFFAVLRNTPDLFIAFSACLFKAKEKKIIFANAGQPPFMICSNGIISRHANPEIAIGADADIVYSETEVLLRTDDLVLMCTDGLYPAGKADTSLGMEVFDRLILKSLKSPHFNRILMDAENKKDMLSEDDATLISIKVK